jgi:sulfatase maturation enzyme AslB (radical SAM superfamily)
MGLIRRAVTRVRDGPSTSKVRLRVFTNGLGLSRATAQFLDAHRVNVTLSFDGVAAAQDERAPGTFHVLDALLGRLGREQPEFFSGSLTIRMTLTSQNLPFLAASIRYFLGKGVRDIEVAPLVTHDPGWGSASAQELGRQLVEVAELSAEDLGRTGDVAFAAFRGAPGSVSRPVPPVRMCGLGSPTALVVDVDGTVAPCGALVPSCQQALPALLGQVVADLGGCHIRDPELPARLASRQASAARMPLLAGKERKRSTDRACGECEWLGVCGVCPVAIGHAPGNTDPDRIPDLQCAWNRLVLEHRATFQKGVRAAASGGSQGTGDASVGAEPS